MATNSTLTPMVPAKPRKGKGKPAPAHDIIPKDLAFQRNFTKGGRPRLNASVSSGTGEGSMGQRR